MSHSPIVLDLHLRNVPPVVILSAVVITFACLSFQITTIHGAWQELARSYRLQKKLQWKRWPKQMIFIMPKGGPFRVLRSAMLRKNAEECDGGNRRGGPETLRLSSCQAWNIHADLHSLA